MLLGEYFRGSLAHSAKQLPLSVCKICKLPVDLHPKLLVGFDTVFGLNNLKNFRRIIGPALFPLDEDLSHDTKEEK
jgi:hypothetical protein